MRKYTYKKILMCISLLFLSLLMTSCYSIETKECDSYSVFWNKMQKERTSISTMMPELTNSDYIQEVYLYYTDIDPLETCYVVYLNCLYSDEQYAEEYKRLKDLTDEYSVINSPSFTLSSIELDNYLMISPKGDIYIRYCYFLLDNDKKQVVYVMAFESGKKLHIENIPTEFLPKEWHAAQIRAEQSHSTDS